MHCIHRIRKPVALCIFVAFLNLLIPMGSVQAAMIPTSDVLQTDSHALEKDRLLSLLERQEVQQKLHSLGVDPEVAKLRINALTDQELSRIAHKMDTLPAGGDAVGAIVGAGVFIFVVLLITDILGLTHVFSFVHR